MVIINMYLRQVSLCKSRWRKFFSPISWLSWVFFSFLIISNIWVRHFWRSWLAMCSTDYKKWTHVYKLIRSIEPTGKFFIIQHDEFLSWAHDSEGHYGMWESKCSCEHSPDGPKTCLGLLIHLRVAASNLQVLAPTVGLASTCQSLAKKTREYLQVLASIDNTYKHGYV